FIVVYLHMYRGLLYGSYRKPRELIWLFGCLIYLCLMAEAFAGYVLPWGQMSYWGAQVIISLFGAIPVIGPDLVIWIQGDYVPSDATLNRLFSLHVIAIPFVLVGLVVAHLMALHEVGSNNPDGIEIKEKKDKNGVPLDGIPFHPYYTVHDIMGVGVFLMVFSAIVFFAPEMGGYFLEYNNFIPADPLKTPAHIAPVWYFTPFYSILRAIDFPLLGLDAKFLGVMAMGGAVVILFFLPWLDKSPVKSIRYRPAFHKYIYALFAVSFIVLGYLGVQPPSPVGNVLAKIGTVIYFGFFLLMPWWSKMGTFKPVPDRVTFQPH
ncbi:MAG: cytochrome b N-terminal domain-containing protein, partial [Limnobacter sp.]|nr:cytochrome b N-terminal domain-containing protein [Limnobacter sp.]